MRSINYIIDTVDKSKSIDRFLRSKGYSSSMITDLKKTDNGLMLNGQSVFAVKMVDAGDLLTVNINDEYSSLNITPENCGYDVVYEDEDYLIYDKPAGVVVHPTKVYQHETLGNDYEYRCKINNTNSIFRPIYRLDRNTSGLVVIAKNKLSSATKIEKEYLCVCKGELPAKGVFDQPIGLLEQSKIKRCICTDGQSAYTEYEKLGYNNGFSVARVIIKTGRTHQIRVHFSSSGFPLVGDGLYDEAASGLDRHALHCKKIEFKHIVTGDELVVRSKIPNDMAKFIEINNILI